MMKHRIDTKTCPACHGTGYADDDHAEYCSACDGTRILTVESFSRFPELEAHELRAVLADIGMTIIEN